MGLAVRVRLKDAERVRKELQAEGVIDFSRKPRKERDSFLIPVMREPEGYGTVDAELEQVETSTDLRTELSEKLSAEELSRLKTAYDLVGDIAIMEVDEELRSKEKLIGETLLSLYPSVKVVVRKAGKHEGELRLQEYVHLAGEDRFETTVTENGVRMRLDIRKTYYSVRSSTERKRVASLVRPGERVLVMFSGIGPFTLVIAKHTEASEVIGVELNEDAHRYAEQNIVKNHVEKKTKALQGDVRVIVPELGQFDRIAMPLPHTAEDFLDVAVPATKENGMIHLYHFATAEEVEAFAKTITERLRQLGRAGKVEHIQRCGNLAPGVHRWSLDIRVD